MPLDIASIHARSFLAFPCSFAWAAKERCRDFWDDHRKQGPAGDEEQAAAAAAAADEVSLPDAQDAQVEAAGSTKPKRIPKAVAARYPHSLGADALKAAKAAAGALFDGTFAAAGGKTYEEAITDLKASFVQLKNLQERLGGGRLDDSAETAASIAGQFSGFLALIW